MGGGRMDRLREVTFSFGPQLPGIPQPASPVAIWAIGSWERESLKGNFPRLWEQGGSASCPRTGKQAVLLYGAVGWPLPCRWWVLLALNIYLHRGGIESRTATRAWARTHTHSCPALPPAEPCQQDDCLNASACPGELVSWKCAPCPTACAELSSRTRCRKDRPCRPGNGEGGGQACATLPLG